MSLEGLYRAIRADVGPCKAWDAAHALWHAPQAVCIVAHMRWLVRWRVGHHQEVPYV